MKTKRLSNCSCLVLIPAVACLLQSCCTLTGLVTGAIILEVTSNAAADALSSWGGIGWDF